MPTLEEAMLMAEGGSGDEENVIIINSDLRTIMSPSNLLLGVYNDKEVLKIPFKMPRFYDGNDLSTFDIFINYTNAMKMTNFDEAEDVVIESDSISFNWVTKRSVFVKEGTVRFTICLKLSDTDGNVTKEFNTTVGYGIVLEGIEADRSADTEEGYSIIAHMIQIRRYVDGKYEGIESVADGAIERVNTALDEATSSINTTKTSAIETMNSTTNTAVNTINTKASEVSQAVDRANAAIDEVRAMVSYPNKAETAAAMSDQNKIYIYTGSETGYNTGHWYYYKTGSGWTDGGLYMSQGTNTDTTLTFPDTPADAKATGEAISKKADYDGSYKEFTSGDTYQIMSDRTVSDSGLMLKRQVNTIRPSAKLGGKAVRDKIVGGSIVWNQQIPFVEGMTWGWNGITFMFANGRISGSGTASKTAPSGSLIPKSIYNNVKPTYSHVYFVYFNGSHTFTSFAFSVYGDTTQKINMIDKASKIFRCTVTNATDAEPTAGATANVSYTADYSIYLADLTQMFGSEIADYIYSLEQTNEGAGVAFFRSLFSKDYYDYNPGEIISVTPGSFESVGFNIWDEEWEKGCYSTQGATLNVENTIRSKNFIKVEPNTNYCITIKTPLTYARINYYDKNKVCKFFYNIGPFNSSIYSRLTKTPDDCWFIKVSTLGDSGDVYGPVYNHDICINLSDPAKNGTYEPYVKHTYPLDPNLTLRGILKKDASNKLYYDGDTYRPDGTVIRRYGIVDLGTINWAYASDNNIFYSSLPDGAIDTPQSAKGHGIGACSRYDVVIKEYRKLNNMEMLVGSYIAGSGRCGIVVKNTQYTDSTAFKAAISGVMLVYELATPVIESALSYKSLQAVEVDGTEVITDRSYEAGERDVFLPAYHNSSYTLDVVGELTNQNEHYDSLGAGVANELLSKKRLTDLVPFNMRKTGGNLSGVGNRVYQEIVGGSAVWNQLIPNANRNFINTTTDTRGYVDLYVRSNTSPYTKFLTKMITTTGNYTWIFSGTETGITQIIHNGSELNMYFYAGNEVQVQDGHKYFLHMNFTGIDLSVVGGVTVKDICLFDLTQMFGSEIADYIYSLEQTNEGDGVAFFRNLFPKDYYEHNPGEIVSVNKLRAFESVGFNIFNASMSIGSINGSGIDSSDIKTRCKTDYVKVISGLSYHIRVKGNYRISYIHCYDSNNSWLRYNYVNAASYTIKLPDDVCSLRVICSKTDESEISDVDLDTVRRNLCINLSDPAKNGTYEPYVKHTYPLDPNLTLRGILKKDASNKLYYDGDTYRPDGTVVRRYGVVTLNGSESYGISVSAERNRISWEAYEAFGKTNGSFVSDKLTVVGNSPGGYGTAEWQIFGSIAAARMWITVPSSIATVNDFKTYLTSNPITVIYELATPVIESAEPYTSPMTVDSGGTEEFVSDSLVQIPVGHNSSYTVNLKDKLEKIVDAPATDGTYTLKVTVTNGVPVFSWD